MIVIISYILYIYIWLIFVGYMDLRNTSDKIVINHLYSLLTLFLPHNFPYMKNLYIFVHLVPRAFYRYCTLEVL